MMRIDDTNSDRLGDASYTTSITSSAMKYTYATISTDLEVDVLTD